MSIYNHFRDEEAVFVDKVLEWKEAAQMYHKPKLTDFLDPREQQIVQMIVGSQGEASVQFYGASFQAERKRAFIYPAYLIPDEEEFQIEVLKVEYATKFHTLEHRQILGALMSLGLKREKYGDILMQEQNVQLVVAREIADYLIMNLQAVGKAKVMLSRIPVEMLVSVQEEWSEKSGTVSSLRLDALLAEMFHLSRQKVQLLIKSGLVKVNWKIIEQSSYECFAGDVCSVRGYGRSKLLSIEGKSKRDKWKIVYGFHK
ncbi:RNA-binding protein [Microbacteriaceae bacterium 4G12]